MATQHSFKNGFICPEFEYQVEELKKRLQYSVANFAQLRFKRAIQMRMSVVADK